MVARSDPLPDPVRRLIVTGPARRDIAAIIRWSVRHFGEPAARRYESLILQGLRDIAADPERAGSVSRPELMVEGAHTYHLSLSRSRMSSPKVKIPRHVLLYRCPRPGIVELARVLQDSRDLSRHLPVEYRR